MKAPIVRKACSVEDWQSQVKKWNTEPSEVIIENEITLSNEEFDTLCKDFFKDRSYITENLEKMYYDDEAKIWHCIAIMSETSDLILLCSSSGYAYMRYSSVITRQDYTKHFNKGCNCEECDRMYICIHKDSFKRFPREIGGLELCPKLALNSEVEKKEKPVLKYNSQNEQGNIFQVLFLTQVEMKKHGLADEYKKMRLRVFESNSYEEALSVICEYVDLIDTDEKL